MYKIAIQFYGHLRSFKKTFEYFEKNVLEANAKFDTVVDVFMHTWDELEHTALRAQYKKDFDFAGKKVSKEDLDFIQKNFKPKGFLCTPQLSLSPKEKERVIKKGFKPESYEAIFNVSYAMQEVNKLREAYAKKEKITYDLIVLVRPDILFKEPLIFHKALNDRTLGKHKFLHFSKEQFQNCVFYAYMQKEPLHDELFRNQKLYVTGIDLLCMASADAMSKLCAWKARVLDFAPMGIEWWLTKQLVDNGLEISLMYYQKPANWTILRTNDPSFKEKACSGGGAFKMINSMYQSEIAAAREAWDFEKVLKSYKNALKESDFLIFEFIRFLADTGKLLEIKELFESKGLEYFQNLILNNHHDKRAGEILLKFYEKFKKALEKPEDLEEKLLFNAYHKNFDTLNELLKSDEVLSELGYKSMIVNYCFNELLAANCLEERFFIRLVDCYRESKKINLVRKQFVLSKGLEYFSKRPNFIEINACMRLHSLLVNLAPKELGKSFSKKIYETILKTHSSLNALHLANQKNTFKQVKKGGKKVALLLCGQVRGNFKACFEVFNERIIKPLNADVFVFTWDTYYEYPGLAGSGNAGNHWAYRYAKGVAHPSDLNHASFFMKNFPLTYAKLNTKSPALATNKALFKSLKNVKHIEIADENKANEQIKGLECGRSQREANLYKMLYGFKQILENVKEYEAINGEYDYLIRVRPDVVVYGEFSFEKLWDLKENEIAVDFFMYGIQDQFFLGTREVMKRMLSIYDLVFKAKDLRYYSKEISTNFSAHFAFWVHCILNDIFAIKSSHPRDLSLFLKDLKKPDVKEELLMDFQNAPQAIKERKDIKEFFAKAFGYERKTDPKEHLSYKLGNALIKAHKTWYKGGYIKFLFESYKIVKEFKEKQNARF